MNRVFVAFGSNLGESRKVIETALSMIEQNEMKIIKKSDIYETEPYGYKDQPNFINGAIEVNTGLTCREVLMKLLAIESELGRVRQIHWGPRVIDLDIVFFNDEVYNEQDLIVPHPDMQNRDFVLNPMVDLDQEFVHPILKKSMKDLLEELRIKN